MATVQGSLAITPQGGAVNPAISAQLDGFAIDYWPTHNSAVDVLSGEVISALPVRTSPRIIAGVLPLSYLQDFYYRVHINPSVIALGNLLSIQTKAVEIWNAYLDHAVTVNSVSLTDADGITPTAPGALPLSFQPLQAWTWQVAISLNGSAVIGASLMWQFATPADDVTLTVTGNRMIPWTALPDWGGNGVQEDMEWLTDVLTPTSGKEQRRQLRIAPRRTFTFDAWLAGKTRRIIEAELFNWSSQVWALPIWPDGQVLPSTVSSGAMSVVVPTTNVDFVAGGLAIVLTDVTTYEILQINTVSPGGLQLSVPVAQTWNANTTRVYPMRTARLSAFPQMTRSTDDRSTISPAFIVIEPCDWTPNAGGASYRNLPVLEWRPDESIDPTASYNRLIVTTDSDTGIFTVDDTAQVGQPVMGHRFLLSGAQMRAQFRALAYALAGRANTIWVPTWNQDLDLIAIAPLNTSTLTVEWTGYTRFLFTQIGRQDIRIELMDGSVRYRRITGAVENGNVSEQLSLDSPLDTNISPSFVRAISYMTPCRLDSDKITLMHEHDAQGVATSTVTWRADLHVV